MRVVLDTNVLVSGLLNPLGAPGRIVDAVLAGTLTVLYDDRIISEYRDVLRRPAFGFRRADVETLLDYLDLTGEAILAVPVPVSLPDAADIPFLEVAVGGHAEVLITGNVKHFKPRRGHHGVTVCTPREFLFRLHGPQP